MIEKPLAATTGKPAASPKMASKTTPSSAGTGTGLETQTPMNNKNSWLGTEEEDAASGRTPAAKPKGQTMASKRMVKAYNLQPNIGDMATVPTVMLESEDGVYSKRLDLVENIKIGRQTSPKNPPTSENGIFDSKVLSRQHAEMWSENGKTFIMDVGSSNGTFLNGERLSPEGVGSMPWEVKSGDRIDFGVDIMNEDTNTILYKRVSLKVTVIGGATSESEKSLTSEQQDAAVKKSKDAVTDNNETLKRPSSAQKYIDQDKQQAPLDHILAILQEEYAKAQEKTTDLNKLGLQLEQARTLIEKQQKQSTTNMSDTKEVDTLRARVVALEDQLKAAQSQQRRASNADASQVANLQSALNKAESNLVTLNLDYDSMKKNLVRLETDLSTSEREAKTLTAESKRLAAALESEKKQTEKLKAQLEESQHAGDKATAGQMKDLESRERALDKKKKEVEDREKILEKNKRLLEEREQNLESRKHDLDDREKKLQIVNNVENRSRRNSDTNGSDTKKALEKQDQEWRETVKRLEDDFRGRLERKEAELKALEASSPRRISTSVSPSPERRPTLHLEKELAVLRQTLQERDAQLMEQRNQLAEVNAKLVAASRSPSPTAESKEDAIALKKKQARRSVSIATSPVKSTLQVSSSAGGIGIFQVLFILTVVMAASGVLVAALYPELLEF